MSTPAFTIRDVLGTAWRIVRARWLAIALATFLVGAAPLFLCCGWCGLLLPYALVEGIDPENLVIDEDAMGLSMLGCAAMMALVHEAVILEIAHAHQRQESPTLRVRTFALLRAAPRVLGTAVLRLVLDVAPLLFAGIVIGIASRGPARALADTAMPVATLATFAWMLVTRGYFGLAVSVAVREPRAGLDAFGRSARLLDDRRAQFVFFRLGSWLSAQLVYCLAVVPFAVLAAALPDALDGIDNETIGWGSLPVFTALYLLVLALHALDVISVAAYHACVAPHLDATAIAKVFD